MFVREGHLHDNIISMLHREGIKLTIKETEISYKVILELPNYYKNPTKELMSFSKAFTYEEIINDETLANRILEYLNYGLGIPYHKVRF